MAGQEDLIMNVDRRNGTEPRRWCFQFFPNAASNPTHQSRGNIVAGVLHTATGRYQCILNPGAASSLSQVVGRFAHLGAVAASANRAQVGAITFSATTGQLTVMVHTVDAAGAEVDIAANADTIVNVEILTDAAA